MKGSLRKDLRYLTRVYSKTAFLHRAHAVLRRVTCPFDRIVEMLPETGLHLDAGCGHGVLLALLARDRKSLELIGADIDARKIAQARKALLKRVAFTDRGLLDIPPCSVDSLSMVDVLYLMDDSEKEAFLRNCAAVLKPGGKLFVKALVTQPWWKYRFIAFEEFIMVRVLRATRGTGIRISSTSVLSDIIERAGFSPPEVLLLHRGYPYPHVCFLSTLPLSRE